MQYATDGSQHNKGMASGTTAVFGYGRRALKLLDLGVFNDELNEPRSTRLREYQVSCQPILRATNAEPQSFRRMFLTKLPRRCKHYCCTGTYSGQVQQCLYLQICCCATATLLSRTAVWLALSARRVRDGEKGRHWEELGARSREHVGNAQSMGSIQTQPDGR